MLLVFAQSYTPVMANLFDPECQNLIFLRVPPLACHFLFLMVMVFICLHNSLF